MCDNDKSSEPVGFSFKITKRGYKTLKSDIMLTIKEFYKIL